MVMHQRATKLRGLYMQGLLWEGLKKHLACTRSLGKVLESIWSARTALGGF
jgi:hypothetical protein